MAEWSMAVVLKTTVPGRVPGVRIPLPPPEYQDALNKRLNEIVCSEAHKVPVGWAAAADDGQAERQRTGECEPHRSNRCPRPQHVRIQRLHVKETLSEDAVRVCRLIL